MVLIFSSEVQNMNSTVFETLLNISYANTSITLISSKIWQLSPEGMNFFGVQPISGNSNEFNPTNNKTYSLIIENMTFLTEHSNYSLSQEIRSYANIAMIEPINDTFQKIISSSNIPFSQNKTGSSGLFIKNFGSSTGKIISIPISIRDTNDSNSSLLLSTLMHNIISSSINQAASESSATSISTTSVLTTSENSQNIEINTNDNSILESDVSTGLIIVSSISLMGLAAYKTTTIRSSTKDIEYDEEPDDNLWESKSSILITILVFFLGIISFFKATIYSNKFNRLTVFQVNDNPVRRNIIEILQVTGFEHFNSLQKKLRIGVSILVWHLEVLEDFNIIETVKFGQYRVVFLTENPPDSNEVEFYCNIRSKIAFSLIKLFLDKYTWNIETLATILYSSNDLIKYHCKKLEKLDILTFNKSTKSFSLNMTFVPALSNLIKKHPEVLQ